jgi:low-affinity ferrous iron transport protein
MGVICAHEYTVLIGVLSIVGLLVGASAMGWSETGQLLCNIPPSIIESFFMMILLTGHNLADAQRREDLHRIYEKRLRVLEAVERVEMVC